MSKERENTGTAETPPVASALVCLELVARLNRVALDVRAVGREAGLPPGEPEIEELARIARRQGFKSGLKDMPLARVAARYPLPAIVRRRDGRYLVILRVETDKGKALVFDPGSKAPVEMDTDEFSAAVEGPFLVLKHKAAASQAAFGFRWFAAEIVKFRRIMGEILLGSFVVQLFGLVTPLFTQVILDKVIVHRSLSTLDVLAIAFVAVTVFEFLLNVSRRYIFVHTASKLDAKLGARIFRHLLALPFMYFERRKVGNIAARIRELDNIREFITNKAVTVVVDLFFSFVFVAVMLLYSVKLTLVVLAFVTVIAVLYLLVTPELRRRLEEKFQMGAASNSYLVESVTGIQTVKSLAVEGNMQRRWEDHLGRYVGSSFRLANLSGVFSALAGTMRRLMTITVLFLGVKAVLENRLTIGQLIAFQMFAGQFSGPVLRLVNIWNEFQQALLSVDRIGDILNHPVEVTSSKAITLPRLKGKIEFDEVSFRYSPDGPMVLDRVSFTVEPGMSLGLVGRSGSGKSTVAKLLQRLYLPVDGVLLIDSIDVRHMNPVWLRSNIGVVLQENYLFSGTIRDNIAIAMPDAPMDRILRAAEMSGAHDFISRLPEGYDTVVGERGDSLSGGQKQRIAIARAILTDPRILIFDEATSALDYESERIIHRSMAELKKGRTTVQVAHRLASIRDCDLILAMDQGRVREAGTHDELMALDGYYRYLYELQTVDPETKKTAAAAGCEAA